MPHEDRWIKRIFTTALFVVPTLWLFTLAIPLIALNWSVFRVDHEQAERVKSVLGQLGTYGDLFGSVNALFSALALLGVGYAVMLQKQEVAASQEQLSMAKAAAEEDKAERVATRQMQANQARVLLISARLGAVQTITQAAGEIARIETTPADHSSAQADRCLDELKLANQYTRIILNDIDQEFFDWGHLPESARTAYRKYLVVFLRQADVRVKRSLNSGWGNYDPAAMRWPDVREELVTLCRQPGVLGTNDQACVESILERAATLLCDQAREEKEWVNANPDPSIAMRHERFSQQDEQTEHEKITEAVGEEDAVHARWQANHMKVLGAMNARHIGALSDHLSLFASGALIYY